jgi:hypothetical protein
MKYTLGFVGSSEKQKKIFDFSNIFFCFSELATKPNLIYIKGSVRTAQ